MLVDGCLRECTLGTEKSDLQWFLLCQAGGHDFAKKTQHLFIAHGSIVTLQHLAKYFRLSLRTVIVHG